MMYVSRKSHYNNILKMIRRNILHKSKIFLSTVFMFIHVFLSTFLPLFLKSAKESGEKKKKNVVIVRGER